MTTTERASGSPPTGSFPLALRRLACVALLLVCAPHGDVLGQDALPRPQLEPEAASGHVEKSLVTSKKYMISAAHPLAAEAGREMLRAGGSAVDATIAAQLVLGLVEPQSSGLGGGAFLLHWDHQARELRTYDGRETAPASARPDRFLKDGKPMDFSSAVKSGLSVGTPGLPRLLEHIHKRHGKLPWATLFEPALKLARDGFEISPRLHLSLRWFGSASLAPAARRYFLDDSGSPLPIGHRLKNLEYAATLEALAAGGADAFYTGPIAEAIVDAVKTAPNAAGDLTLADLASYAVTERPPLCIPYRKHRVCGMGPPSSGGMTVAQTLGMIERFDLGRSPDDAMGIPAIHLITEAQRLAFADRNRYVADPAFVSIPDGLLNDGYLASRAGLIDPARAMAHAEPGNPGNHASFGFDATIERAGTSHLSVIDADGNAVALTTTIEGPFGSGLYAAGFLLNNELTDFSFRPTDGEGRPIANRVEGGKRPRSSMAPTIVFDDKDEVFASLGSPGGSRIILFVTKALIGLIDWRLDAQTAINLPNFGRTGKALELEFSWSTVWRALLLKGYGHEIAPDVMTSGLHVVARRNGAIEGGADPRREGVALGD